MMYCLFDFSRLNLFLVPDALQDFLLAEGMYHVISFHLALRKKIRSRSAGFTSITITCQTCNVPPSWSGIFSIIQSDLSLQPT